MTTSSTTIMMMTTTIVSSCKDDICSYIHLCSVMRRMGMFYLIVGLYIVDV